MNLRLATCILISVAVVSVVAWLVDDKDTAKLITYYEENLRGNLFAGFLTVGGFLLSLKTFIVIKLKENVFDHKRYRERFDTMRRHNKDLQRYAPLKNISDFLFWSVLTSMLAAVAQLTVGLAGNYWLDLFAIWLAVLAVVVLFSSLFLIKSSLNDYFQFLDEESKD